MGVLALGVRALVVVDAGMGVRALGCACPVVARLGVLAWGASMGC